MSDVIRADIADLTVMSGDLVVLTYTVHGGVCRIGLAFTQVELIEAQARQARIAMQAGRDKRAAESAAEPVTDHLPAD